MKNVIFFTGSLQAGGTEAKLVRNFLPLLKSRGKLNPKLLLLRETGEFLEILPKGIERLSLNETAETNIIKIIPRFRNAVRKLKADVVVSCMWYPASISHLARLCGRMSYRHIVHDTTNMTEYIKYEFGPEKYQWAKIHLFKKAYKNADSVIVVSQGEKEDLVRNFSVPDSLINVIYNPIDIESIRRMSEEEADFQSDKPVVVSVGRLIFSKGFDILLRAFQKVRSRYDCRLIILGRGDERKRLEELSEALNLGEDVAFLGFHHNPFKFMRKAQIFCSATRYEGLGNAIIEAMALGLPAIATDCLSGPGETLDAGKYGLLVPTEDPEAIAEAITKLLSDNELRKTFADLSVKRASDYSVDKALTRWEEIILNL
ncbi:MAG TPA: glycosyltransferase [Thermodesulfovibrionales bacterium]|nr:glycosyltransferase [Thermodesulfovibrionales bacterium]